MKIFISASAKTRNKVPESADDKAAAKAQVAQDRASAKLLATSVDSVVNIVEKIKNKVGKVHRTPVTRRTSGFVLQYESVGINVTTKQAKYVVTLLCGIKKGRLKVSGTVAGPDFSKRIPLAVSADPKRIVTFVDVTVADHDSVYEKKGKPAGEDKFSKHGFR